MTRWVVARIRLPQGVDRNDALQEASVICLKRIQEGVLEPKLRLRVWGDLRDFYARQYRNKSLRAKVIQFPVGAKRCPNDTNATDTFEPLPPANHAETRAGCPQSLQIDLYEAIAKLPDSERRAIVAVVLEGKTQVEYAEANGLSTWAIQRLCERAKKKLAGLLEAYRV